MVKRVKAREERVVVMDLCGTVYDSRRQLVEVDNEVLAVYGKPPITEEQYMSWFSLASPNAVKRFYTSMGISEEKIPEARALFREWWNAREPPPLISGAKEAFETLDTEVGEERVFVVTNEAGVMVERRFRRDGLERYLPRATSSPPGGKAQPLSEIARAHPGAVVAYVGDTVSDGREVEQARAMGADNLRFVAVLHQYALNTSGVVSGFVARYDWARSIDGLHEIGKLANGLLK
jgi:phosphoglycolate phosphatase-like HAD superfamily hydrolase